MIRDYLPLDSVSSLCLAWTSAASSQLFAFYRRYQFPPFPCALAPAASSDLSDPTPSTPFPLANSYGLLSFPWSLGLCSHSTQNCVLSWDKTKWHCNFRFIHLPWTLLGVFTKEALSEVTNPETSVTYIFTYSESIFSAYVSSWIQLLTVKMSFPHVIQETMVPQSLGDCVYPANKERESGEGTSAPQAVHPRSNSHPFCSLPWQEFTVSPPRILREAEKSSLCLGNLFSVTILISGHGSTYLWWTANCLRHGW